VITTGGTATITLTTLPANYDVALYSSNGTTQLAVSQKSGTTNESISRTYTTGTYYAKVYGKGNATNASSCYTLRIALGTASRTDEISGNIKMDLHPNPAREILNVSFSGYSNEKVIEVFNSIGKMMIQQKAIGNTAALHVSTLPAGLYLIKVTDAASQKIFSDKLLIQ